jgi:AmiR/NasT family two-component response regulator
MEGTSRKLRVMIVEDEFIIADEIAMIVEGAGHSVIGPVASVEDASALLVSDRPDFAIIDANLRGQSSSPLARSLAGMEIPFCVCTGYRIDDLKPTFGDVAVIQKPVRDKALLTALNAAIAGIEPGRP